MRWRIALVCAAALSQALAWAKSPDFLQSPEMPCRFMTTRPEWASLRFHVRQGTAIVRVQRTRIDVEFFEDTHPAELLAGMALKRKGANNVVGRYETMNSDDGGDDVQGRYEAGRRRYGNGPIAWQYLVVGHPSLAVSVNCFQELP